MRNRVNVFAEVVEEREKAETAAREAKDSSKTPKITKNKAVKGRKVGRTAKKA